VQGETHLAHVNSWRSYWWDDITMMVETSRRKLQIGRVILPVNWPCPKPTQVIEKNCSEEVEKAKNYESCGSNSVWGSPRRQLNAFRLSMMSWFTRYPLLHNDTFCSSLTSLTPRNQLQQLNITFPHRPTSPPPKNQRHWYQPPIGLLGGRQRWNGKLTIRWLDGKPRQEGNGADNDLWTE
jgi:hypothetical protein